LQLLKKLSWLFKANLVLKEQALPFGSSKARYASDANAIIFFIKA